jgi:23S rRNA G2445 N2-methylase RlmL
VIVDELRIVGSTQTNVVMAAELVRVARRALGVRPPEPRKEGLGQLVYPFDRELARVAVTYMRTPTRVVWDVFRSRADRLEPLYDELVADIVADRRELLRDRDGISVEARNVGEFAAGERQVVGTVKNALIDAAAKRRIRLHVDPERADQRWVARLSDNGEMTLSLDLGGGSLSQRGWRRDAGDAPLREHLAAVLLMLCRFDPRNDALVDPMCGAGTIPIEAVLAARGAPRSTRMFGKDAQPLWADASPLVVGCDLDLGVLAAARDNARAAKIGDAITWQRCDVADLRPDTIHQIALERGREPQTGVIVANPPYGERLDPADLEVVYAAMAETMRRFRGWRAGFLVGNPLLERIFDHVVGRPRIKKPLANANLRAYFYLYEL